MPRKKLPPPPPPRKHARGWSEGTVTALPTGRFRAFRARVHNADGTSTRASRTFPDRQQAEAWAAGEVEPDVLLLGAWLDRWLALRLPTVSPRSRVIYRRYVVACAPIATLPLSSVTTEVLQAHANSLLARWSRTTVATWRSVLSGAFADAVPRYLAHNPMRGTRLPKPADRPVKAWRADEVARLLAAAKGRAHETWLWLALGTGIRLGEARALTWADVDLAARTVTISKSVDQATEVVGPTKSGKTRVVDLPDELVPVLVAHRARQSPSERRVCVTPWNGKLPRAKAIRMWVERLCERAGVTVLSPHAARHAYATLALEAGVPLKEVSESLGHSSVAITANAYSHNLNQRQRRAANALGAVLAPKIGSKRGNDPHNGTREAR